METLFNYSYSCYDERSSNISSTPVFWDIPERYRTAAFTTAVFTLIFIIIGLPSNALVILSISWQHLYRESTHILLLNLAVADFLVCALVMPLTVVPGFAGSFILGNSDNAKCRWCQTGIAFVALCLCSLHTLALLSADRFVFVKFPMKYHRFVTARKTLICIIFLWILCIAISSFPLFGFGDVRFNYSLSTCSLKLFGETSHTRNINYLIFLVAESFCPLVLLVITNVWLVCIVQKHIRNMYHEVGKILPKNRDQLTSNIKNQLTKKKNQSQLQLTKVFGAILVSNVFSWLPLICRTLVTAIKGNDVYPVWVYVFVYLSITSSAVFHPLIQAGLIPEIRTRYKHFLTRAFCYCKCCTVPHDKCETNSAHPSSDTELGLEEPQKRSWFCCDILSTAVLPNNATNNNQ